MLWRWKSIKHHPPIRPSIHLIHVINLAWKRTRDDFRMRRASFLYRLFVAIAGIFVVLQISLIAWHPPGGGGEVSSTHAIFTATKREFQGTKNSQERDEDWICSRFRRGTSAATAWRQLGPQLLEALHHPRDTRGLHTNWTQDLLELLTPHVLEYTLKGYPNIGILRPLIGKLSQRIRLLLLEFASATTPPPFKIIIFGGSIVEGTGCMRSPIPGGKLDFESLQECAWPFRLEHALNHLMDHIMSGAAGTEISSTPRRRRRWFEIHNLAAGGTNSEAAIPMLRYWLSPVLHPKGADIIVNAYSANDNLPPAFHATTNTTLDSFHLARILQRNLEFVQAARSHKNHHDENGESCHPFTSSSTIPMILYVNDYLGNQQESIIGEGQLHQAIQWLTDLEPTMGYVSVSHAVRRWVFADTSEDFFSAPWIDRKGRPTVDVHYGMAGHVTTTIALLYYFLKVVLDYCDDVVFAADVDFPSPDTFLYPEDYIQIEIPSKEWVQYHQPPVIRPNITEANWRQLASAGGPNRPKSDQKCDRKIINPKRTNSPCAFAFLAAPLGTHQQQDLLSSFLEPFTLQRDGWAVQNDFRQGGFQNKLGLVAMRPGATISLGVNSTTNHASSIRVVTIQYLKSYGDLWKNSRVECRAQIFAPGGSSSSSSNIVHEQVWVLEGVHEQAVSISYFHHVALTEPVPPGGSFRFQMTLVEGQIFKINALMFCSR
jgi:hypothetical protein